MFDEFYNGEKHDKETMDDWYVDEGLVDEIFPSAEVIFPE